jgi:hypothetical protein
VGPRLKYSGEGRHGDPSKRDALDSHKHVIGSAELVDFPDWGVTGLRAKVDTGAKSSALHVENILELPGGWVQFEVRLLRRDVQRRKRVRARISRRGRVKPSSGETQARLFVKTRMRLGPVERDVEVSLVDRQRMIYRMLLGRTALAPSFLVDPGRRYVLRKPKKRSRKG